VSEKIKPCLHAGDEEEHRISMMESGPRGIGNIAVYCTCGWIGPSRHTEEEAIAAWNLRPREDRLVKLLGEAQGLLREPINFGSPGVMKLLLDITAALKEET
jgi:hypothetical protein